MVGLSTDHGGIALMWRGGCIIRSAFLGKIKEAFDNNPKLNNLLVDEYFNRMMNSCQPSWRRTLNRAISAGIPMPAMSSALSFFDGCIEVNDFLQTSFKLKETISVRTPMKE